jgi:predicted nucleotidyltransferase
MAEVSERISRIAEDYINEVNKHINVDRAFLYGSYAKGNYSEHSDLDIAIFSESFKGKSFVDSVAFLFSLARKYKDVCIEPVAFTESDLQEDNPFVKEIITTGKEIKHRDFIFL